jgi:hypothetical protein
VGEHNRLGLSQMIKALENITVRALLNLNFLATKYDTMKEELYSTVVKQEVILCYHVNL